MFYQNNKVKLLKKDKNELDRASLCCSTDQFGSFLGFWNLTVKVSDAYMHFACSGIIKKTRTVMECLHRFCRECIDKSMRLGYAIKDRQYHNLFFLFNVHAIFRLNCVNESKFTDCLFIWISYLNWYLTAGTMNVLLAAHTVPVGVLWEMIQTMTP